MSCINGSPDSPSSHVHMHTFRRLFRSTGFIPSRLIGLLIVVAEIYAVIEVYIIRRLVSAGSTGTIPTLRTTVIAVSRSGLAVSQSPNSLADVRSGGGVNRAAEAAELARLVQDFSVQSLVLFF